MAPNRRRGSNKSTAAAAARLKWKVDDLVLAKVKGFPAWPATVSDPQKWGYPADVKKVLVYFFGTQQIAFCNPVDIEEFTEEKKVSLLGKRHGKGSDFVRALNEIVDSFEKLKKHNCTSCDNITDETNITNENNSDESLTKSVNGEAPTVTAKHLSGGGAKDDLHSLTEVAVAAAAEDALHDKEMQLEEANSNSLFSDAHAYPTRSKVDAVQSQKVGVQSLSHRKLRSSSRVDASRHQNVMMPSVNIRSSRRSVGNVLEDRSVRRSGTILKSSDDSEGLVPNSPASLCHYSSEGNGSEIMTVDSDTLSFNDGSTADSAYKSKMYLKDIIEKETELNHMLDFQKNTIIVKKKRKPNRKKPRNNIVAVDKLDEVVSEAEVLKNECFSPGNDENECKRYGKEDGDEHLPFVKRARVRMGRPSSAGDEEGTSVHEEAKPKQVLETYEKHSLGNTNGKLDSVAVTECVSIRRDQHNSPLLPVSPSRKPQFLETRKNILDCEAALPPSKRLHRALEAMSANVAEDCPIIPSSSTNNNSSSSSAESSEMSLGKKTVIEFGSRVIEDHMNGNSQPSASEFCDRSDMTTQGIGGGCVVASGCGKISHGSDNRSPELRKDSSGYVKGLESKNQDSSGYVEGLESKNQGSSGYVEGLESKNRGSSGYVEGLESKNLKLLPVNGWPKEIDGENQQENQDSTSISEELSHVDRDIPCLMSSPKGGKIELSELEMVDQKPDNSSQIHPESTLVGIPNIGKAIVAEDSCGRDEKDEPKCFFLMESGDKQRSEFVKEARPHDTDMNVSPPATPVKVLNSNSVSDDHLEVIIASASRSSCLTKGPDPVARSSPPSSLADNIIPASDNSCHAKKKGTYSPDVRTQIEKAKLAGKPSCKLELLSTFEAIIRSLTGTKESIGRATRVAIDCAKFGVATKVVETLASNLESESSPTKKVDLFFLVDSITQCSGGMKGDAGIYPSEILALLPRLLAAAAPPGASFYENHRQCLKVLRVWLERKVLPEPIIRHHIRELNGHYGAHLTGCSSRSLRFERSFDDPIREMEGMLVDEYGSNSSIQLPGFSMPPMLKDDDVGSDSDGESFEAVTPEHHVESLDGEKTLITAVEECSHILQDVDGELEMEDVAPSCDVENTSSCHIGGAGCTEVSHHQSDNQYGLPFESQEPKDTQSLSATLPRSPRPLPPSIRPHPPPSSVHHSKGLSSFSDGSDSRDCFRFQEPRSRQYPVPRTKSRSLDAVHRRPHDNRDCEAQLPRQTPDCNSHFSFRDQPSSHSSSRASDDFQPTGGAFRKGFHLHPPQPAVSNQFSYIQEQRTRSRRHLPPPSQPNRFHRRNSENGNFYRYHDRNRYAQRDDIGEYWRPPLSSISGPCYHDDSRIDHAPLSYGGPPCEPTFHSNRWNSNYPPRSMNHRQFNPYRPSSEGPIPVTSRGPNFWKSR